MVWRNDEKGQGSARLEFGCQGPDLWQNTEEEEATTNTCAIISSPRQFPAKKKDNASGDHRLIRIRCMLELCQKTTLHAVAS